MKTIIVFLICIIMALPFVASVLPSIGFSAFTDTNNSVLNRSFINIEIDVSDDDGLDHANIYLFDESFNLIREMFYSSAINTFTSPNYGVVSFSSAPLITDNYIFTGGDDGVLFQINKNNLSETISSFTATGGIVSKPIINDGYIYVGDLLGYIYQLDATNVSNIVAIFDDSGSGRGFISKMVVSGGYLYTGNNLDGMFYQLDANNISNIISSFTADDFITASPLLDSGFIYICDVSFKAYKLDATNISIIISESASFGGCFGELTINDNFLYVADSGGIVRQLSKTNLSIQYSHYDTATQIATKPIIINGYFYIGNYEPRLYQFNATDLTQLINSFPLGGAPYVDIVFQYGDIFVATGDNYLLQFDPNDITSLKNSYTSGMSDNFYPTQTTDGNLFSVGSFGQIYQFSATNITTPLIGATNTVVFSNLADGIYYFNSSVTDIMGDSSITLTRTVQINTTEFFTPPIIPPIPPESGYISQYSAFEIAEPIIDLFVGIFATFASLVPHS